MAVITDGILMLSNVSMPLSFNCDTSICGGREDFALVAIDIYDACACPNRGNALLSATNFSTLVNVSRTSIATF